MLCVGLIDAVGDRERSEDCSHCQTGGYGLYLEFGGLSITKAIASKNRRSAAPGRPRRRRPFSAIARRQPGSCRHRAKTDRAASGRSIGITARPNMSGSEMAGVGRAIAEVGIVLIEVLREILTDFMNGLIQVIGMNPADKTTKNHRAIFIGNKYVINADRILPCLEH